MSEASTPGNRFELAAAGAAAATAVGGMGVLGWFGRPWSSTSALVCVTAGAIAAGLIERGPAAARVLGAASFLVGGITFAAACAWTAAGRLSFIKLDLVVPFAIALVPFVLARWWFGRLKGPWAGGHTIALAASIAFCGAAGGAAFVPPRPEPAATEVDENSRILPFEIDRDGKTIIHGGAKLGEPEVKDVIKRMANTYPSLKVRIRLPRGVDSRAAAAVVVGAAMAQNLEVFTIESP